MKIKKGLKRVISFTLAAAMAVGLVATGGGSHTVYATAGLDPANTRGSSQILGRAADFGILADTYIQNSHTETNFALNTYSNTGGSTVDVDLAGDKPVPFIIGALGTKDPDYLRFGNPWTEPGQTNYSNVIYTLEVGPEVKKDWGTEEGQGNKHQGAFLSGGAIGHITLEWTEYSDVTSINSNVTSMIQKIKDESESMKNHAANFTVPTDVDQNHYTLDMTTIDTDGDSVVYVNVPDNSKFYDTLKNGGITIKKYPNTVVVINLNKTAESDSDKIAFKEYKVEVVDKET